MLLLVHGVAPGGTPAPQPESRQPPPTERPIESESSDPLEDWSRSRIERELVRRLAAGEEVATLHAELRQRSDTPRRATIESTGSAAPDAIAGTVERLLAADLLAHYELESVGERLIAGGAHETAIRRWEKAKRLYQERRERLLDPGALDDLSAVLERACASLRDRSCAPAFHTAPSTCPRANRCSNPRSCRSTCRWTRRRPAGRTMAASPAIPTRGSPSRSSSRRVCSVTTRCASSSWSRPRSPPSGTPAR
jgi:hypothetical protein